MGQKRRKFYIYFIISSVLNVECPVLRHVIDLRLLCMKCLYFCYYLIGHYEGHATDTAW